MEYVLCRSKYLIHAQLEDQKADAILPDFVMQILLFTVSPDFLMYLLAEAASGDGRCGMLKS